MARFGTRMLTRWISCGARTTLVGMLVALPGSAAADIHTVADFGDSGAPGQLRTLVTMAAPGDTIVIPAGRVVLGEAVTIDKVLTVVGAGPALTVIQGSGTDRVFYVAATGVAVLSSMAVVNGYHVNLGGGVDNRGTATLVNLLVEDNEAGGGGGVGNEPDATMTMEGCTIRGNRTSGVTASGGGVGNAGTLTIAYSTISDNHAAGTSASANGGGIQNARTLTITNSTISGNRADATWGGGIHQTPFGTTLVLVNVTVAGNRVNADRSASPAWGGGVGNANGAAGSMTAVNTLIADNRAHGGTSADCYGVLDSLGHNLIETSSGCLVAPLGGAAGDVFDTRARLLPLAENGGPTETHGLARRSPAVDAGDNAACAAIDQRGQARPVDGDRDGVAVCDIGAFERPRAAREP